MSDLWSEGNVLQGQKKEQWFALTVTPKLTQLVLDALERKGYECFTPWQTNSTRHHGERRRVPAFPGYVFARMDLRLRFPVLVTPGVRAIVGYGRQPAAIDDAEIQAIKRVMDSGVPAEHSPAIRGGDRVVLTEGPLAGLMGVLMRTKSRDRVLVQVTLINQALAVDVDAGWIRSAQPSA